MRGSDFVYEVAYELQEDLKELSQKIGEKDTENIVRKIVGALEVLEWHAGRYEGRQRELGKLEEAVERLEKEKSYRVKDRLEQEEDRKKFEEKKHNDSMKLMRSIEELEEENCNLKKQIDKIRLRHNSGGNIISKQFSHLKRMGSSKSDQTEIRNVHLRLKETLDSQTEEIHHLKKELAQRCIDFDAMQQQCITLSNTNADICERLCNSKLRSKRLIEEKSFIEARLIINQKINSTSIHNDNEEVFKPSIHDDDTNSGYYFYDYEHQCASVDSLDGGGPGTSVDSGGAVALAPQMSTSMYEPEFSWEDVANLWKERDQLRSQFAEKQEQLRESEYDDSPGPVQGPINREPIEKLMNSPSYLKNDTGISRFFQKILKTSRD